MTYSVRYPSDQLVGSIQLPSSKSISNRLLTIRALGEVSLEIEGLSEAEDTQVLLRSLQETSGIIDVGHAGTAMRFLISYLACSKGEYTLTGSQRMQQRPIGQLVKALQTLGAEIKYLQQENYPPISIHGKKIKGGEVKLEASISSQFISSLLMIGPTLENGLTIHLLGEVVSSPYIEMTIQLMRLNGAEVEWTDNVIQVKGEGYNPIETPIEGDWSAAAFWYAMVALSNDAEITLKRLYSSSLQGDRIVARLFEPLGVQTKFIREGVTLKKVNINPPSIYRENLTKSPDLAQPLIVALAGLNVAASIGGLKTLSIKETNRLIALETELRKLGFDATASQDGFHLSGKRAKVKPQSVSTYEDHRMAMAFAALAIKEPIHIENPKVVVKSYPGFWEDLRLVGFEVE